MCHVGGSAGIRFAACSPVSHEAQFRHIIEYYYMYEIIGLKQKPLVGLKNTKSCDIYLPNGKRSIILLQRYECD